MCFFLKYVQTAGQVTFKLSEREGFVWTAAWEHVYSSKELAIIRMNDSFLREDIIGSQFDAQFDAQFDIV